MSQNRIDRAAGTMTEPGCEIRKPIGLEAVCGEIDKICSEAPIYRAFGSKPDNLLVYLDQGNGRTTVTEYAADRFRAAGVLDFASGLDDFITIKLDGTLSQYRQAMEQIRSAAVYQNHYKGIVEADVMALAAHQNETQYGRFFSEFPEVCRHAFVIFFAPAQPSGNEEKFLDKLTSAMGCVRCLVSQGYTTQELAEIVMRRLCENGLLMEDPEQVHLALCDMVEHSGVREVKGALLLAAEVARRADYSGLAPLVRKERLWAGFSGRGTSDRAFSSGNSRNIS